MIGHTSAYPWASVHSPQEAQLIGSMNSIKFEFMGESSTYWNLYFGWGILVSVLLLSLAGILWFMADMVRLSPRRVGIITGITAVTCLIGSYLALQFFFLPPTIMFFVIFLMLATSTVQLLRFKTL
jgi:uncharacterized membrane protein YjgN (DUF898 family)